MKDKLIVKDENGKEKEYTILVKFTSATNNKDYIIYTDFLKENNIINCYANIYNNDKLEEITTKEEIDMIEKMINTISSTGKYKYTQKELNS